MNKMSLLELAKKLNIPRRNYMKRKEKLEEAIKDTIRGYKEIIFGVLRWTSKAASHRWKNV